MPGLDGIRGLAVLAVLGYHLDLTWAGGGFLGVEVFFTLSGFLITQLLVLELRRRGRVDVAAFAMARARRLLPALVAGVLGTLLAYRLALPAAAAGLRVDTVASLLYAQNWHLVVAGIPYGAEFDRPAPFLHLWSLSVELQLYLGWGLLLVGFLARFRRSLRIWATVLLAVASAAYMAFQYNPDGGGLVYYDTGARASGFLLGAALALAWRPEYWSAALPRAVRRGLDAAGLLALAALLVEFGTASEFDSALYQQGGFLRAGAVTVVLVAAATRAEGMLRTVLANGLLVAVGRRSYGVYIYHWPVFALIRGAPGAGWLPDVLALAITFGVTEISYRWLETPIRRGGIGAMARRLRLERRALACTSLWAAVTVASLVVANTSPTPTTLAIASELPSGADASSDPSSGAASDPAPVPASGAAAPAAAPETAPAPARPGGPSGTPALVVGDSIAISSTEALRTALGPETTVQAEVGRQFAAAPAIVVSWTRRHDGPVVIDLGANGTVEPRDLDALLAGAADRRVVLVGVAVPRRWRDGNNAALRDAAARHFPQVVFVDWASIVASHPGSVGTDRVHPSPQGRTLLADAIAGAVRS